MVFVLQENKALYSFEDSGDYVVDVRWSPTHPALFAAADAAGRLDLWNLNRDTEVRHTLVLYCNTKYYLFRDSDDVYREHFIQRTGNSRR